MMRAPSTTALLRFGAMLLAGWLGAFSVLSVAHAHPALEEAERLAADLEFEASLAWFQRALDSGELTRAELVELLGERVFVLHALQRREALIADFVWLSALSPESRLDLRAPPDMVAMWTSVRDQGHGPLTVALSAEVNAQGQVDARATLAGTVPEGASARLWLRRAGQNFELLPEPELHTQLADNTQLALYAQAVGLGGVVVATDHGPEDPLLVAVDARAQDGAAPRRMDTRDPRTDGDGARWTRRKRRALWGAGAAAVVTGVVLGVVLGMRAHEDGKSDDTRLTPMVTF